MFNQRELMRHILCADDQAELERKILDNLALVIRDHDTVGIEHLDVLRFVRGGGGGGKGMDLSAEGGSREDSVVALYW
jgi:hypothetical protein